MEVVVLVNEENQVLGTTDKSTVHCENTPLHRAFSVFVFDQHNRLLLQRRAANKIAWPSFWSNSCCGHPMLNESNEQAVVRRCQYELGIKVNKVTEIAPYRYCFRHQNIMENEICPILVARIQSDCSGLITLNPEEVQSTQWIEWTLWLGKINHSIEDFSPWSVEESKILAQNKTFNDWLTDI